MQDNIQLFEREEWKLRAVEIDGTPWFFGKDVAAALGYSNPQKAIRDHVDEEDRTVNESFTVNGTAPTLVNESGIYALILTSKLPAAKQFKRWVTSDILPTIRRHGMYATPQAVEDMLADPDTMIATLNALKAERAKVAQLAPKAGYYDACMNADGKLSVRDAGKLLRTYDPSMGERKLRSLLRGDGMIEQQTLKATAKAIQRGYMAERQHTYAKPDGTQGMKHYGVLTPKGLAWCVERYCGGRDE